MKHFFIVNPVAGAGRSAKRWAEVEPILRSEQIEFDYGLTAARGDATRMAMEAVAAGYTGIVAVGGDGTCREVVNGLMNGGAAPPDTYFGVVPTGRGVDLCRTIGIPLDPKEAARRLPQARLVDLDVGEVEYRRGGQRERCYFVNFGGVGFDVEVVRRAISVAPNGGGTVPYLTGVFLALMAFRSKAVELVLDDEVIRRRVASVVVANGQYFGGGMRIAPTASPTDGLFDVVVIGDVNRLELVINFAKVYEGTHTTHPKVSLFQARRVEVHSTEPLYFQVDGDPLGETPVAFRLLPGALKVLV